jgi:tRNA-dihydrouridine synthase
MLQSTGCDGVAIGRIAIARPWVFAKWTEGLKTGPEIFLKSAIQLTTLLEKHYEPAKAFRRFKRFAFYFAANFQFGHTLYTRISNAPDMPAAKDVLLDFFEADPKIVQRPNMNFFR